ncbi:MAG TPA: hypothetical protein VGO62_08865 [Myxococcota bacterium]
MTMPDPRLGMNRELDMLKRYGPLMIAFWGWASLAIAEAKDAFGLAAALVGAVAALFQARAFKATAIVEGLALLAIIALVPADQIGFVALGAAFVIGARVIARLANRRG